MRWTTWFGLILCNTIWSLNPLMGKILLETRPPLQAVSLRYFAALFAALLIVFLVRPRGSFAVFKNSVTRFWLLVLSIGPFVLGPFLQSLGLSQSRATDNALIIAIEPFITLLLAALFLRQSVGKEQWISLGLALSGFALLSDWVLAPPWVSVIGLGNLLMLISLFGEGIYSVAGHHLLKRGDPLRVFTWALLIAGLIFLLIAILNRSFADSTWTWQLDSREWLAVLWLGPLGTTITYVYWLKALQKVSVPQMVVTLYFQPVLGAIWGVFLLNETLSGMQWTGGAIILIALSIPLLGPIIGPALKSWRSTRKKTPTLKS